MLLVSARARGAASSADACDLSRPSGAASSADACDLSRPSGSAVCGIPCSSHSLVSRDSGLDRKSLSRRSCACDVGAFEEVDGACGLFEELAPLLDPRACPEVGSGSV
ncbi:hypothetical protein RA263_07260 [Pseudomonas syringae pv. tagetis]|uniref:Secreted protein n=1 Tax=Pseudomonas syringae pv. tagetis TaxID=129140 RepID=A0ABW7NML5_9PSED